MGYNFTQKNQQITLPENNALVLFRFIRQIDKCPRKFYAFFVNEPLDLEGIQTPWNPRFRNKVEKGSVSPALTQKQEGISDECQPPAYQQMSRLCSEQV